MHETRLQSSVKLSWWPTPQDYNEAIQIPRATLQDSELKSGTVVTDNLGLPRPVTGSFATVYRMRCKEKEYAVRLFLRNVSDQAERYKCISDFVQQDQLTYTVTFNYLKEGIYLANQWLPALKMEWVEGSQLDEYIVANLGNSDKLAALAIKFLAMMNQLRDAGIAHGDLQHGNIIVGNDELFLVDYDGMYVPAMKGLESNELGHRNYQLPARANPHFGPYLDNFSAWVIYTSLRALALDPKLMNDLGGGDDCLLFKMNDFVDPLNSPAFAALERHSNTELNCLARFMRSQLGKDPAEVAYLEIPPPALSVELETISDTTPTTRTGARLGSAIPDWLQPNVLSAAETIGASAVSLPSPVVPASIHPTGTNAVHRMVPAELNQPRPRPFARNKSTTRTNPFNLQLFLIPFAYAFVLLFFHGMMTNSDTTPVSVMATIKAVGPKSDTTALVRYSYEINGRQYMTPQRVISYPAGGAGAYYGKREMISIPPPASKQAGELFASLLFLVPLLLGELAIWMPALKIRDLVTVGLVAVGRIERVFENESLAPTSLQQDNGRVVVSYTYGGTPYRSEKSVNKAEFSQLKVGDEEVLLCNPSNPADFEIYRFCLYRAADPGQRGKRKTVASSSSGSSSMFSLDWWKSSRP